MYFIPRNIFKKKLLIFFIICLLYVAGVLGFQTYIHLAPYYKPYYLKAQILVLQRGIENVAAAAASVLKTKPTAYVSGLEMLLEDAAESIPVLLYHGVLRSTDGSNVDLDTFIDQMTALKNAGYQTVSIDDFYSFLRGEKKLPKKSFLLTFDDGRKDGYYPVDPILRALRFRAVMFAIEKFSFLDENSYYLTKDELITMGNSGRWDIESHSRTHRNLETVPADELEDEIVGPQQALQTITKKPIIAFAFPFGEFGQESTDESKRAIMSIAQRSYALSFFQFFTSQRFTQNYPDATKNGHYLVKRISVLPTWSGSDLLAVLNYGEAKPEGFDPMLRSDDGWVNTLWGNMTFKNNRLLIDANPESSGSAIILDGSRNWKDYQFTANMLWRGGSNIYLWARYQDDDNYVACNFSNDLVHVEETFDGVTNVIKGNKVVDGTLLKADGFEASIRVDGRTVECRIDGRVLATTQYLDESLSHGGIGIKVWDRMNGVSRVEIVRAAVEPITSSDTGSLSPTTL